MQKMKKNYTISIEVAIMEELKKIADIEERTLSSQLKFFIKKSIEEYNKTEKTEKKPIEELAGKKVSEDYLLEFFKDYFDEETGEGKRAVIQYLKSNKFDYSMELGVGACYVIPDGLDIAKLVENYKPPVEIIK